LNASDSTINIINSQQNLSKILRKIGKSVLLERKIDMKDGAKAFTVDDFQKF